MKKGILQENKKIQKNLEKGIDFPRKFAIINTAVRRERHEIRTAAYSGIV